VAISFQVSVPICISRVGNQMQALQGVWLTHLQYGCLVICSLPLCYKHMHSI